MSMLLQTPVCEVLGCRLPIVLAGMGGVARSELVAAVTAAGGFGFLGMVREPVALLRREVEAVRAAGHERFGVNLIPAATPPELLEAEIAALVELKVPVICLFWDIDRALVRRLREAGILVVYQVGSVEEGVEARDAGAQVLIAQGVEAGGHVRGTTPLQHLLPALVAAVDVPVLAAGGIGNGADLVTALAFGAEGVVLGTALIATRESFAHDFHKERLLTADPGDTVLTEAFHVNWPAHAKVRVLASDITAGRRGDPQTAERTVIGWEEGRPIYLFSTDSPLRSMTGDFGAMALYAGKGVGRVRKMQPAAARLEAIVRDAEALLAVPGGGAAAERSSPICYAADADPEYMGFLGAAALTDRLAALRDAVRTAFEVARRDRETAERQIRQARWTVILTRLAARHGAGRAGAMAGSSPATLVEAEAVVLALAGKLVAQIAEDEDDVRRTVTALIAAYGGGKSASPLRSWTGALPV